MSFFWLCFIATLKVSAIVAEESTGPKSVFADTTYGPVEGKLVEVPNNVKVNSFMGIPFAKPPLRELRFKPPSPPEPWQEVLKTTQFHTQCVQTHVFTNLDLLKTLPPAEESEDCLYLNVFAPAEKSEDLAGYPVMLWIHGGGLNCGSVHEYGTKKITERIVPTGVVFVSIAYRMGPYGFLSTGDSDAPGNYGLLDMVAALEWVKANINSFGGNPARVTVFGESAGAGATSLLSLSPLSRDLFSQAILMSGAGTAAWNVGETSIPVTFQLAEVLECDLPSHAQLLDCLRTKSVPEIQDAYQSFMNLSIGKLLDFSATVDKYFLPKPVLELFAEAPRKRVMAGTTAQESGFFVDPTLEIIRMQGVTRKESDVDYHTFHDEIAAIITDDKFNNSDVLRQLALDYYLNSEGDKNDISFLYKQYIQVMDDVYFHVPQYLDAVNRLKSGSDVWLYSYEYYDDRTFPPGRKHKGAYHASELQYLLDAVWNPTMPEDNEETSEITDMLVTLWTNFAKFGNPTPTDTPYGRWEKLTEGQPWRYYTINTNPGMSSAEYHKPAVQFWSQRIVDVAKMSPAEAQIEASRHEEL